MNSNRSIRVLVVDDEVFVRDVTARALVALGCPTPLLASNGAEALELVQSQRSSIDLVISDLLMPDMDGVELVRHLAEQPEAFSILFMSGANSSLRRAAESLGRAYGLRVLGALSKPIDRTALGRVLEEVILEPSPEGQRDAIKIDAKELERGVKDKEFVYHYQPKLRLTDRRLESVEALARWQHPRYGLVPPGQFIGLAENSPFLGRITEQLVEIGIRQLADWHKRGIKISMAMNLSPSILSDVSLPDRLSKAVTEAGLAPNLITFEITETGVAEREAIYLEIITRLQMKGFSLSIDDFGTGQSSLQKLEALPFTELKIDRQFVHGLHANDAKRAIFEASLDLAKRFKLKTVAEGVELPADLEIVRKAGCDLVQGYIIEKPLAPTAFEAWAISRV